MGHKYGFRGRGALDIRVRTL
uniref:Uncharacterized protein n=1 Tax=Anguilla anguilla TaxID=7936 RepID=A0A0E9TQ39_ANGAN